MRSTHCPFLLSEEICDPFYGAEGGDSYTLTTEECEYFEVSIGYLYVESVWGRRPRRR